MNKQLSGKMLLEGVAELAGRDRALARAVERHGPPPLRARQPGFTALLKIILEQQVSLVSARAVYKRLQKAVPAVSPGHIEALSAAGLRSLGLTRQKAACCHALACSVLSGELELGGLHAMSDAEAVDTLLGIRGVGPWTANIYLLTALRRPDVWPDGDLALAESARRMKRLRERPARAGLNAMAEQWRPWRAVAARILWHAYLCDNRARAAAPAHGV